MHCFWKGLTTKFSLFFTEYSTVSTYTSFIVPSNTHKIAKNDANKVNKTGVIMPLKSLNGHMTYQICLEPPKLPRKFLASFAAYRDFLKDSRPSRLIFMHASCYHII